MLGFRRHQDKPFLPVLLLHDDADGQFDYTVGAEQALHQDSASGKIVSITNDWATVFPQPDEQSTRPRRQYGSRNGTSCECAS